MAQLSPIKARQMPVASLAIEPLIFCFLERAQRVLTHARHDIRPLFPTIARKPATATSQTRFPIEHMCVW